MPESRQGTFNVGRRFHVWQDILRPPLIAALIALLLLLAGMALFRHKRALSLFLLTASGLIVVLLILAFSGHL